MEEQNQQKHKAGFKEWLEVLQQESWQLELLISGFAIILLVQTKGPIEDLHTYVDYYMTKGLSSSILDILGGVLSIGRVFLIVNLIMHVVFRGLWIATIGLRYVSGDIQWEHLKYGKSFTKYLNKKVGDFDSYIESLEKICSAIFAFSFIIIFCLLSAAMFLISFMAISILIVVFFEMNSVLGTFGIVFISFFLIFFFLGAFIYFIDFITLGRIKRWEKMAVLYLPMYRFYSTIALSFLYRPLIYNMIDNKFGRKLSMLFVPYIIIGVLLSSMTTELNFFKPKDYAGEYQLVSNFYEDQVLGEYEKLNRVSIPSMFVQGNYLPVFMRIIKDRDSRAIEDLCPDFDPFRREGSTTSIIKFEEDAHPLDSLPADERAKIGLQCYSKLYEIYLDDSLISNSEYFYYNHPISKVDGVMTMLFLDSMDQGKHVLKLKKFYPPRRMTRDTTLRLLNYATIPFWKE